MASFSVRLPLSTRQHLGTQQPHAEHIERLPLHVLGAHVDVALEAKQRAGRGRRHAMLTRAGLRDDASLAHPTASSAWPSALLILCAPVCVRSSRFRKILAPPAAAANRDVS